MTVLCALAMAATAAAWALTQDPVVIVTTELAGLFTIATVSTLVVRRELGPLKDAAHVADAITAGELSQRVGAAVTAPTTEVGRLAHALDRMLDEVQEALDARKASEERMRQFVADASHELRTPLQSLRGYAELHRHGALPDRAAVDEAMERMLSEVHRMGGLVESLLMLARFDEYADAEPEPVDLSRVVTDSCRDAAAVEPLRPHTVDVRSGVTVLGDEAQLRGLLANLLGNIRMHCPPEASYAVRLRIADGHPVLVVRDDGPGIPEHALPHVFDRFYRADKGRSRAHGGSGLGMSIVAAVAELHHARIHLDSTPGRGTRVEIVFPRSNTAGL
ncbi:ATP-binding protein [Streptomyces sp. NPDC126497]|uniref:sensor histidine kinase n=1 Tax=Streptomyces sp. NPDC126497 TaxID=3155313 RepID=UPI00332DB7B2